MGYPAEASPVSPVQPKVHLEVEIARMATPSPDPSRPASPAKSPRATSEAGYAGSAKSDDGPAPEDLTDHDTAASVETAYETRIRRKGWNTGRKHTPKKSGKNDLFKSKKQARRRSKARSKKAGRRTKKQKDKRRKAERR